MYNSKPRNLRYFFDSKYRKISRPARDRLLYLHRRDKSTSLQDYFVQTLNLGVSTEKNKNLFNK
jgi:hypothetical protein